MNRNAPKPGPPVKLIAPAQDTETEEKQPRKQFEPFDCFGLQPFAERLTQFLTTEHKFVDGALVVSLNAPFGSGKTWFLEMWTDHLEMERRSSGSTYPIPILLNAWESDFCGDPFLSIISGFDNALAQRTQNAETLSTRSAIKEAAKDLSWFSLGALNEIVSKWAFDPQKAGELAEAKKKARQPDKQPDILDSYHRRMAALGRLKTQLRQCFGSKQLQTIVMVDELDRCRPTFAVEYLETIKHVFDIRGVAFVLAVDKQQLASSSRALFGAGLEFDEYYRKFAQRQIALPEPGEEGWRKIMHRYFERFVHSNNEQKPGRLTAGLNRNDFLSHMVDLQEGLQMTPRQLEEVIRMAGHVTEAPEPGAGPYLLGYALGSLIMCALFVKRPGVFRTLGEGPWDPRKVFDQLKPAFRANGSDQLFLTIMAGCTFPDDSRHKLSEALMEMYRITGEHQKERVLRDFDKFRTQVWGHAREPVPAIYNHIVNLRPFFDRG